MEEGTQCLTATYPIAAYLVTVLNNRHLLTVGPVLGENLQYAAFFTPDIDHLPCSMIMTCEHSSDLLSARRRSGRKRCAYLCCIPLNNLPTTIISR